MVCVGQYNFYFLQTTLLPRIKYCDLWRAPPALNKEVASLAYISYTSQQGLNVILTVVFLLYDWLNRNSD